MSEEEKLRKKKLVITNLRACLISAQGGVPLASLNNDYRQLLGENIPYKQLGFSTLEAFLGSISDFNLKKKNGESVIEAKASETSEHISKLVERQKKATPGKLRKRSHASNSFSRRPQQIIKSNGRPRYPPTRSTSNRNNFSKSATKPQQISYDPKPSTSVPLRQHYQENTNKKEDNIVKPQIAKVPPEPETVRPLLQEPLLLLHPKVVENKVFVNNPAQKRLSTLNEGSKKPYQVNQKKYRKTGGKLTTIQEKGGPCLPGSFMEKLQKVTEARNWLEPEFTTLVRKPKGSESLYSCRVTIQCPPSSYASFINEYNDYSTFPDEYRTHEEAKEMVAKKAYNDLMKLETLSSVKCDVTKDSNVVIERVGKYVEGRNQGIWAFQVESDYRTQYLEVLPCNWIEIIKTSSIIKADKLGDTTYIIRPKTSYQYSKTFVNPQSKLQHSPNWIPPKLELPESEYWNVCVTRVVSTNEVWFQFVGNNYSVPYDSLLAEMNDHYNSWKEKYTVPYIEVGNYYVGYNMGDNFYYRTYIEEIYEDRAKVLLIDVGDIDYFHKSDLFVLDSKYTTFPSQAVKCSLDGLQHLGNNVIATQLLRDVVEGRILVAVAIDIPSLTVVMHSTAEENPINLNEQLLELMGYTTFYPKLDVGISKGFVTSILAYENLQLQIFSKAMNYINDALMSIEEVTCLASNGGASINFNKFYLMGDESCNEYYRALILSPVDSNNELTVKLVDLGKTMIVSVTNMYDSNCLSGLLGAIPPQALQVILKDLPASKFSPIKAEKLQELVPETEIILVKQECNMEGIPIVELFKRMQPGNVLVSINHTVNLVEMLEESVDEISPLTYKLTDMTCCKTLRKPEIPDIDGSYFDIYVVEAATPSNFTIQPLEHFRNFKNLMRDIEVFYGGPESRTKTLSEVECGTLCAAFDRRGTWCRAVVYKVINNDEITVRFSDYGNVDIVSISNIRQLMPKFCQLPAIGFIAKLAGIVPLHGDWAVDDCLRMQELIEGKKLVSVIHEKIPNPQNTDEFILGIQLIDTNASVDVDIAHALVVEGRAKYI